MKERGDDEVGGGVISSTQKSEYYRTISRPKSSLTPGFTKEIVRHQYHPSSKLFVKAKQKEEEVDENMGYMSLFNYNKLR